MPTAAVQRGPNGTFVYIANDDNTVSVRPVTVAQQDDSEAVIVSGIDEGERVVTTGFAQLNDGTRISIGTPENLERPAGSERRRGPDARRTDGASRPKRRRNRTSAEPPRQADAASVEEPSPAAAAPAAAAAESAARGGHRHRRRPSRGPQRRSETRADRFAMSVSSPFIFRPIATSLLGVAVMLGGHSRLLAAAGGIAAAGRLSDHPGDDPASRRQCRNHRLAGHRAAGTPVRPDPGAVDHDVVEFLRDQPDHPAVRAQPRHRRRRAGRAVRHQCRRLDAAAQPSLSADLFQGEPRRRAGDDARADVADHLAAADERSRRHPDGAAAERGERRRPCLGPGRPQARDPHPGRSRPPRVLRHRARRPAHRHRGRQRGGPQRLARRRPAVLHHRLQRPDHRRRRPIAR